jgi:hypothetical protein
MKMVINADWGGYEVPDEVEEMLDHECKCGRWNWGEDERVHPLFIEWVKNHKNETDLSVVNIPDNATDYEILEDDGFETVIAVVDGKIVYLDTEDSMED